MLCALLDINHIYKKGLGFDNLITHKLFIVSDDDVLLIFPPCFFSRYGQVLTIFKKDILDFRSLLMMSLCRYFGLAVLRDLSQS